ncbi:hypothetical protein OAG62_01550 [bacterium]|nr:hypothetical protein [bacterium]
MDLEYLKDYVEEAIIDYPSLESDLIGLWDLAVMEVEQGESEYREVEHAVHDIDDLIQEYLK